MDLMKKIIFELYPQDYFYEHIQLQIKIYYLLSNLYYLPRKINGLSGQCIYQSLQK